jgi:bisphosphoglycerate-independent phosphoglycerate mutase (AlkP superfamily)
MPETEKKPIVLLLLQGWGLNLSWQKNAIIGAKTDNFDKLWREYNHLVIGQSPSSKLRDKRFFYESFFSDSAPRTTAEVINQAFADKSVYQRKGLQDMYAYTVRHNSKVHFIATLSSDDRFNDLDHLFSLIKIAKRNGVYQQYVHLLIDVFPSEEEIIAKIESLQSELSKIGGVEIATISSFKSLYRENSLKETLKNIILAQGKTVQSLKQAFLLKKKQAPGLGSLVVSSHRNAVSDFDAVIFTDYNAEAAQPLSKYFSGLFNFPDIKRPKFLKVSYLIDALAEADATIIPTQVGSSWFSKLYKCNCTILAERKDLDFISSVVSIPKTIKRAELKDIDNSNIEERAAIEKIFSYIMDKVEKKSDDLLIVDLPFIIKSCLSNNFQRTQKTIKIIDSLLPALESCIIKNDGVLILSSFCAMAEEIDISSSSLGQKVNFSTNPLPWIEISNGSKKASQLPLGILDFVNIKHSQSYLKSYIKNYLEG